MGTYSSDVRVSVCLVGDGVVDAEVGSAEGGNARGDVSGQREGTDSVLEENEGDHGSENDDEDISR